MRRREEGKEGIEAAAHHSTVASQVQEGKEGIRFQQDVPRRRGGGGGSLGRRRRCPEDAGRAGAAAFPEGLPRRSAAQGRYSQPHRFADDVQAPALPRSPALPPAGCQSPFSSSLRQGEGKRRRVRHGGRAGAAGAARGQRRPPKRASLSPALRFAGSAGARGLPHTQRIIFGANAA